LAWVAVARPPPPPGVPGACGEGDRPLRRTVQRRVEKPLSKRILAGEFGEGDTVLVDLSDGEYVFSREEAKVGAKV